MKRTPRCRRRLPISVHHHRLLILALAVVFLIPGHLSSNIVTLESIEIFTTHEWAFKPIVYFQCQGENKTTLPDVKQTDTIYAFHGEESWQPLTELPDKKCKRCGFYEKDTVKPDDVFDEWELCLSDFIDGKYARFKENEFNATFVCLECIAPNATSVDQPPTPKEEAPAKHRNLILLIVICTLATVITAGSIVACYKYWQKKRREHDQARFLKLFEDVDDIEDELGLGTVI